MNWDVLGILNVQTSSYLYGLPTMCLNELSEPGGGETPDSGMQYPPKSMGSNIELDVAAVDVIPITLSDVVKNEFVEIATKLSAVIACRCCKTHPASHEEARVLHWRWL